MIYVGIDPGLSGGIAAISDRMASFVVAIPMPVVAGEVDARGVDGFIGSIFSSEGTAVIVLEKAQSMPGNGGTAMFSYGRGVGRLEGVLLLRGWRFEEVRPTTWKKVVLKDTAKDKAAAIDYVTRAFPGVSLLPTPMSKKPHDGMADALCLAEYGRRTYGAAATPTP